MYNQFPWGPYGPPIYMAPPPPQTEPRRRRSSRSRIYEDPFTLMMKADRYRDALERKKEEADKKKKEEEDKKKKPPSPIEAWTDLLRRVSVCIVVGIPVGLAYWNFLIKPLMK